ncbi:MAG: insulinase family protein [Lentisphaerae bacterium]|nr:insulinase family protein [Lentisphaerota bacterium]
MFFDVHSSRLPNGVRVATARIPHVQSVAMGVWIGVGGRYETRTLGGVSHFIEHLLFKGTEKLSARDISQSIEGHGGYCNAFTQEEMTCYYARVAFNHMPRVLSILGDMYLHPRFDPSDIDKERDVIVEEIRMYQDRPEHVVQEMLSDILWKDHELGRPLVGTPETLTGLSRERLVAFKRKKYVPDNTLWTFAGPVDHHACVDRVARLMKGLKNAPEPTYTLVTPSVAQERMALKAKDIEQSHLAMGFRLFGRFDKRRYTLKVLSVILGENMSSRLFQIVREKHGLAYSVHSSFQLFAETGVLAISAGLDKAKNEKALSLIVRELNRLKEETVGAHELKRAREYIVGQLRLGLESTSGQMMWMGESILTYGRAITPDEFIEAVSAVTADDVQKLAHAILRDRCVSLSLLSPGLSDKDGERLKTILEELSA